jgi:hypothetical protein
MSSPFSILVNTTDNFEDCWNPFFKLFKIYWPEYNGKIYLNTETKTFDFPGLRIISISNNRSSESWSSCLRQALDVIDEGNILYLQEDYFFTERVQHKKLDFFYSLFCQQQFDCLHLTDQSTAGPFSPDKSSPEIWQIDKNAPYRLSTQAAFWKKDALDLLIRDWENAWQFEIYGSKRADLLLQKVMVVNTHIYGVQKQELIPYVFTGIVKGRWNKEVVHLFAKHDIHVNFSERGFDDDTHVVKPAARFIRSARNAISGFRSRLNILKLRK